MAHLCANTNNVAAFLQPIGEVAIVSDIDGLRVTLDDRRIIHFRCSGNAPEMRCYAEAHTAARPSTSCVRVWRVSDGGQRRIDWRPKRQLRTFNDAEDRSRDHGRRKGHAPLAAVACCGARSSSSVHRRQNALSGDPATRLRSGALCATDHRHQRGVPLPRRRAGARARHRAAAVLLEPVARNTAAAVAAAATLVARSFGENTIIHVLASDHEIDADDTYFDCVRTAVDAAARRQARHLRHHPDGAGDRLRLYRRRRELGQAAHRRQALRRKADRLPTPRRCWLPAATTGTPASSCSVSRASLPRSQDPTPPRC